MHARESLSIFDQRKNALVDWHNIRARANLSGKIKYAGLYVFVTIHERLSVNFVKYTDLTPRHNARARTSAWRKLTGEIFPWLAQYTHASPLDGG